MRQFILMIAVALMVGGCARNLAITYASVPSGAALYQAGQLVGITPTTLIYHITDADKAAGQKKILGTSVQWTSGATATVDHLVVESKSGAFYTYTFCRPEGFPGLDVDIATATQQQMNAAMAAQSHAAHDAQVYQQISNTIQQGGKGSSLPLTSAGGQGVKSSFDESSLTSPSIKTNHQK